MKKHLSRILILVLVVGLIGGLITSALADGSANAVPTGTLLLGDVNGDGQVTASDVLLLRLYLAGFNVTFRQPPPPPPPACEPSSLVTLTTEYDVYPVGTTQVTAILANDSAGFINFGARFELQKWDGEEWVYINPWTGGWAAFAIMVPSSDRYPITFSFTTAPESIYDSVVDFPLVEGQYRIRKGYHYSICACSRRCNFYIYAYFNVQ